MLGLEISPLLVAVAVAAFTCAGFVKGVSGLGVQAIVVPAMALVLPLETAIGLGLLPAFVTSLWQGLLGGALRTVWRRTWAFLLPCCLAIFAGAALLARVDSGRLGLLLGTLLCVYAVYALARPALPTPGRHERWLSPVVGALTGIVGGATGVLVMPGGPYLQLLRLGRDELVQAVSLMAVAVMPVLALALGRHSLLPEEVQLASAALLLPTLLGLAAGAAARRRISEARFRQLFLWVLLLLGAVIVGRHLLP